MSTRSLLDRFRGEIRSLLDTPQWSERGLADAMGSTQGKLQGWMRGQRPTTPKLDSLEALAEAQGVTVPELVQKIYGLDTGGDSQTWAELGRQAIANPQAMRELLSELSAAELNQLSQVVLRRQRELLGGEKM